MKEEGNKQTKRDSFVMYRSICDLIKNLPVEQRVKVYEAIINYGLDGEQNDLKGMERAIFAVAQPLIDANNKRYENSLRTKKNSKQSESETEAKPKQNVSKTEAKPKQNVSKSEAKPKQNRSEIEAKPKQNVSKTEAKPKQNVSKSEAKPKQNRSEIEAKPKQNRSEIEANVNDNETGNDNVNVNESENENENENENAFRSVSRASPLCAQERRHAHSEKPPTVREVTDYCRERKNNVDPQRFVDYYNALGWKIGNTHIVDWRSVLRMWEKTEIRTGYSSARAIVGGTEIERRHYTEEQLNALFTKLDDE